MPHTLCCPLFAKGERIETHHQAAFQGLASQDDKQHYNAFLAVLEATEWKVDWAYLVWDELVAKLAHDNSYQRSIAARVLCNLAKSDSKNPDAACYRQNTADDG
jgi:hypothetical protein